jgi:hypothetical protein
MYFCILPAKKMKNYLFSIPAIMIALQLVISLSGSNQSVSYQHVSSNPRLTDTVPVKITSNMLMPKIDTTFCDEVKNNADSVYLHISGRLHDKDKDLEEYWASMRDNLYGQLYMKKYDEIRKNDVYKKQYHLPDYSKVIEYKDLTASGVPGRAIFLWMKIYEVFLSMDSIYTCPDVTTGKGYYAGEARFTLVDTRNGKIINTIPLYTIDKYVDEQGNNGSIEIGKCSDIPFAIGNPFYKHEIASFRYFVNGGDSISDGIAEILHLEDYNGDGNRLEFAIYNQWGCMMCNTTVFGYSRKQDKLLQYEFKMKNYYSVDKSVEDADNKKLHDVNDGSYKVMDTIVYDTVKWMDNVLYYPMNKDGVIEYHIDYRGRGGSMEYYSISYNKENECFTGIFDTRERPEDKNEESPWFDVPEK